jgi:hypothetical protein
MDGNMNSDEILNNLVSKISKLEQRINTIESQLNITSEMAEIEPNIENEFPKQKKSKSEDSLEYQIGQNWFAKMGVIVFVIGFMFLLSLPYVDFPSFAPALLGYICGVILLFSSKYFKKSFPLIEGYLVGSALVLFYFATLRLHFFNSKPFIESLPLIVLLLLIVVAINSFVSIKRKSSYLFNFSIFMGFLTAIISSQAYYLFIISTLMILISIYYSKKFNWRSTMIMSIVLTYLTHFIWFINNPFLTHNMQLIYEPEFNIIFILAYIILFSIANLFYNDTKKEDNLTIFISALNIILGYLLFTAATLHFRETTFGIYQLVAFVLLLGLSIWYWVKLKTNYSTFYYAMTAYLALSLAIVNQFSPQDYFIWLCWQSLLVVSTAVWFKSKHIILANFIIYIFLILGTILTEGIVKTIGFHYGIVAMLSARILNWQKSKLELKTEFMRNAYLITSLLIIPYSLYHIVPAGYVGLTWIAVALVYYGLSKWLKAIKYRWMALATLIMTCVYVIIHAITSQELSSKIYSFLILGAVLVIISLWYAKAKNKQSLNN